MSNHHRQFVTDFCHSLRGGDMAKTCAFLTSDVHYHNTPWAPLTGHAEVRKLLDPLLHGTKCALRKMDIQNTVSDGEVIMNARIETWTRREITVELPVAGLFVMRDGLIARWVDYWDLATIKPLLVLPDD